MQNIMKRFLDRHASDLQMSKDELFKSIAASEGRILFCETIDVVMPMLLDITNCELAASMGADALILNLFDLENPSIMGLPPCEPQDVIRKVKELTGRIVGLNLEAVDEVLDKNTMWGNISGRKATAENAEKAVQMGADFIVLTGNPGIGVTNEHIIKSLRAIRQRLGEKILLIAGKMHGSGILSECGQNIITAEDVQKFAQAGADVILLPAPGTVPGITTEYVRQLVETAHAQDKLTMTAIGTSQEGADKDTIREIALMCKMTGTDIHHLGDAGYIGMSLPENIMAYSIAIRGIRHTYRRIAASIKR